MKFWQKAFVCVMILFLLGLDVMSCVLIGRAYALNRDYAVAAAETEHEIIKKSLFESIKLSENVSSEIHSADLAVIVNPYAGFYRGQNVYFNLYQGDVLMYGNAPFEASADRYGVGQGERISEMKTVDGKLYCFVASNLSAPYEHLQYVYIKDEQALDGFKNDMISSFVTIGVAAGLILSIIMLTLLIGLTRPFRKLNAAAAEISGGNFDMRVSVKSRDEVGDFARSFNLMIDRVGEHIFALARMTESKQNFIDNLAHEIRTPVTAIIGYGELLKYANCSEADKETAVGHILSQGRRIQNISFKLLDLAYMEHSHIQKLPVLLTDLFAEVTAALNFRFKEKGVALRAEWMPASVVGDAELLKSLFVNLLDNAIEASDTGGVVEIRAGQTPEGVTVEITDCGKGMDETEPARIAEPFYRIDQSRSGGGNHAGLGLTLCARICELHAAAFNIVSDPGAGTTVKILFTPL
ncbi:MAG: HAMP domain-containing histidine kinase [Clostridiales Family XIII bacterium]|jgi:signal transduction histidine kinase|nr:HAMP domain-containing histidine kinase [Clostridiales Family XIII bacterium]